VDAATTHSAWPPGRTVSVDDPGGTPFLVRTSTWSYDVVSSDYLRTMKIPVTRGRDFAPGEFAEPVVIVDQFTARELWKGRDPVGQLVKLGAPQSREPWLRVVGVATVPVPTRVRGMSRGDIAQFVATGSALRNVYVLNAADTAALKPPTPTRRSGFLELVARGTDDPRRLPLQLRRAVGAMQPNVAAMRVERWDQGGTMRDRVRHDFVASLFAVFAFVALVLAALGVYAVISHTVAQRTREFGVRIAVGADARDIERMVLYDGSVLSLLGIALGLLVTVWSAQFLRAFLFSDYDRYDSPLFAGVALALFVAAWLASYIPARRATRINPVEALRND
jgi:putative ABC transport system permease protein